MTESSTHIFLDNSNIFISAQTVCSRFEPEVPPYLLRIHFPNLFRLAAADRLVAESSASGSIPFNSIGSEGHLPNIREFQSVFYERGLHSNSEQAVDESIQLKMYRALTNDLPRVAVLLSGDGKGFSEGRGFLKALFDMYTRGWGIEVCAWSHSCSRELRTFAEKHGTFTALDDYYWNITYIQGGRCALPLPSIPRHKLSQPDGGINTPARIASLQKKCLFLEKTCSDLLRKLGEYESHMQAAEKFDLLCKGRQLAKINC